MYRIFKSKTTFNKETLKIQKIEEGEGVGIYDFGPFPTKEAAEKFVEEVTKKQLSNWVKGGGETNCLCRFVSDDFIHPQDYPVPKYFSDFGYEGFDPYPKFEKSKYWHIRIKMLEFKKVVNREEIPKQLWGNIFSPKDLKDVSPVPCRVVFLHPWDNFSLRNAFTEETEGVLTSSVWFEGCPNLHADPPFLEGEVKLEEKFSDSLDIFYSANQNNGQQIVYHFNSPEKEEYRDLYSYLAIPILPCYDTWGPEKMLMLKLYKNQVKTLERVLYLIKKWKESGRKLIPSLRDFIVLMGDVDLNGNGGMYLPVLEFLEGVEYGELQGIAL